MQFGSVDVDRTTVERIRRIYAEQPWTTAAGLARRFGLPTAAGAAIVVGGFVGIGGLRVNAVAPNLARLRHERRVELEARLAGRGRVRLEPRLEGLDWTAFDAGDGDQAPPCPVCAARARRLERRRRRVDAQRARYVPLVGASKRAMNQRIKARRAAAAGSAAPTPPTP